MWAVLRRRRSVWLAILALAVIGFATLMLLLVWADRLGSRVDDTAAAAAVLTGGGFFIALLAGALAVIAYAESIRRPALTVRAVLTQSPDFGTVPSEATASPSITVMQQKARERTDLAFMPWWEEAAPVRPPLWLYTALSNSGEATARYVVLTVEITGVQARVVLGEPRWTVLDQDPYNGCLRLEWDGGADWTVHPTTGRDRRPPAVQLNPAAAIPGSTITVSATAVADGTKPVTTLWRADARA